MADYPKGDDLNALVAKARGGISDYRNTETGESGPLRPSTNIADAWPLVEEAMADSEMGRRFVEAVLAAIFPAGTPAMSELAILQATLQGLSLDGPRIFSIAYCKAKGVL